MEAVRSVWQLAMGWTVQVSNPSGSKIFAPFPGAHPASCTMGTGSLNRG